MAKKVYGWEDRIMEPEIIHAYISIDGRDHHVGTLKAITNENNTKIWEFRYSEEWLNNPLKFPISPGLDLETKYIQVPYNEVPFIIHDTCPDSWGLCLIIKDPEVREMLSNAFDKTIPYSVIILAQTMDFARQGAIRFSYNKENPIFEKVEDEPSIPIIKLAETAKDATAVFEGTATAEQIDRIRRTSINMGGAQPKTCVVQKDGRLSMAKFYKKETVEDYPEEDERIAKVDKIKLEAITVELMRQLDFDVPTCEFIKYDPNDNSTSVIVTERFDRDKHGNRYHFMSAATLVHDHLRKTKGTSLYDEQNIYYTFIARAIRHFNETDNSLLPELWRRMLCHVMLKNTDNHLKNQGFLYNTSTWQWEHAKCYDVNPSLVRHDILAMRISENHIHMTIENAIDISESFDVDKKEAQVIALQMAKDITENWEKIARSAPYQATDEEIEIYSRPFQHVKEYYENHRK